MNRYYVTLTFAVEAETAQAAEALVARRADAFMQTEPIICPNPQCMTEVQRPGGNRGARVVIEATTATDEPILRGGPPLVTEELGLVETELRHHR